MVQPKAKEMRTFVNKKGEANKTSDGVVCDSKQVLVYEMRKKQTKT